VRHRDRDGRDIDADQRTLSRSCDSVAAMLTLTGHAESNGLLTSRPTLYAPHEVMALVREFGAAARDAGHPAYGEALSILAMSARFAGWQYRITREQTHGFIDCSALVAQAHWLGAAIGVPFIADNQRQAYTATDGADRALLPADVLVRHRSRADAPGGSHNHVVLYLGKHPRHGPYVIESAPAVGVRVRPLDELDILGGVRRFVRDEDKDFSDRSVALELAAAVPKLGRLGARLVADEQRRHRGVDIAVAGDAELRAPIAGELSHEGSVARITAPGGDAMVVFGAVDISTDPGRSVKVGQVIGRLAPNRLPSCNPTQGLLHLEFWTTSTLPYFSERGMELSLGGQTLQAFNAVYATKLGLIESPVKPDDVRRVIHLQELAHAP
jgi:hypothetical protein